MVKKSFRSSKPSKSTSSIPPPPVSPLSPAAAFGVKIKAQFEKQPDIYRAYIGIVKEISNPDFAVGQSGSVGSAPRYYVNLRRTKTWGRSFQIKLTSSFNTEELNAKLSTAFSGQPHLVAEFRSLYPSLPEPSADIARKRLGTKPSIPEITIPISKEKVVTLEEKEPIPMSEPIPEKKIVVRYAKLRHLARGMSSIQDPTLASVGYSSLLVHSFTGNPKLKALYNMISDFRMFTRVWTSPGLVEWGLDSADSARASTKSTFDEFLIKLEAWSSILYQLLENVAYLSSKGVIKLSAKLEAKIWMYSCIMWALYVQLELIRLAKLAITSKGKIIPYKQLFVNMAWLPLTVHWSMPSGFLTDKGVGLFGTCASLPNAVTQWRSLH